MPKRTRNFGNVADLFGMPRLNLALLKGAITASIKGSPLSRDQVADAVSLYIGRPVTASMVNDWCAPAKPHLPRLDEIAAIVFVTRSPDLLDAMARAVGLRVLTRRQADRFELVEVEDEIAALEHRAAELRGRVAGRRGGAA